MKVAFSLLIIVFVSCRTSVKPKEIDYSGFVEKKIALVGYNQMNKLVDTFGHLILKIPSRLDTFYHWTDWSDCNSCGFIYHRFSNKKYWVGKDFSGVFNPEQPDSLYQLSIRYKLFKEIPDSIMKRIKIDTNDLGYTMPSPKFFDGWIKKEARNINQTSFVILAYHDQTWLKNLPYKIVIKCDTYLGNRMLEVIGECDAKDTAGFTDNMYKSFLHQDKREPITLSHNLKHNMNPSSVICVCGAGTMGSGIAQTAAAAGFYTILYELNNSVLEKAKASIESNLQLLVEKRKITGNAKEETLNNLKFTNTLHDCLGDVIIEAIIEKPETKIALFNQLAEINHSETVFASNTSSLSITQIASGIKNPQRVIGMHFFNPATIMKLVEVVNTNYTDEHTTRMIMELAKQMNKTPVLCNDSPGFIVNRVARPYYLESLRLAEENIADFKTMDLLMESTGFKMGPFKLMDLIGNDINYAVSCSLYEQMGHPARLKPSDIQKEKVEKGELGKKGGKGYYNY